MASLFNTVTIENALTWPALAGDFGNHFDLELAQWAADWAIAEGLDVRGHVLVWPGWDNCPAVLRSEYEERAANDEAAALDWLAAEVITHVEDTAAAMAGRLVDWHVVNEPWDNHDLMDLLGDEAMVDWFTAAREADPGAALFINDYGILNAGTTPNPHREQYLTTIESLLDQGVELDGIGLQGHFGADLAPPEELLELFDQFAESGQELWITEFDMDLDDDALAADYLRDVLTVLYSHPSAGGFVMWGFWDGVAYSGSVPIYDIDWNLKPSGQAYRDLVFGQWWTDNSGTTDDSGRYVVRGFTGDYEVTVRHDGTDQTQTLSLDTDGAELRVVFE